MTISFIFNGTMAFRKVTFNVTTTNITNVKLVIFDDKEQTYDVSINNLSRPQYLSEGLINLQVPDKRTGRYVNVTLSKRHAKRAIVNNIQFEGQGNNSQCFTSHMNELTAW